MTDEEQAIALYDQVLTFASRVSIYSDESVTFLKQRLDRNSGLEPPQLAALMLFINTMQGE